MGLEGGSPWEMFVPLKQSSLGGAFYPLHQAFCLVLLLRPNSSKILVPRDHVQILQHPSLPQVALQTSVPMGARLLRKR